MILAWRVLQHALCYTVLFFVHRIFILPDIGAQTLSSDATRVLLMGLLSDASVACGIVFIFVMFRLPQVFSQIFMIVVSILLMGHVSYVQFYHVTLRAWHVSYLWDWSFLKSSMVATLLTRGIVHIPLSFILALLIPPRLSKPFIRTRIITSVLLLACCILANSFSQRWGRRSDLSEHLRNNVVVGLLVDAQRLYQRRASVVLTNDDWKTLREANAELPVFSSTRSLNDDQLEKLVRFLSYNPNQMQTASRFPSQWSVIRESLRNQFNTATLSSQARYVIVVLMESTRSIDSKLYQPDIAGSMPELDEITAAGIRFANGYSNGTVTRAGAESTLCNSQASMDINAMRNAPLSKPVCMAEMISPFLDEHHISYLFTYLHGGYLSFDRQNEFWSQNDFDIPIDILNQPSHLPRTDWGLSDNVFVTLSTDWFKEKATQNSSGLNFVFLQTMTNHFAWKLPNDADDDLKQMEKDTALKNLVTVRYQSRALGRLVKNLKDLGIWKKSVVLFVGDHGVADGSEQHPTYYSQGTTIQEKRLQADAYTKVYYSLAGGLVEQALAECKQNDRCKTSPVVFDRLVTQSDFLPTVLDLLGKSHVPLIGKSYFEEGERGAQVIDVEDSIYIPELGYQVLSKKEFFNKPINDKTLGLIKAKQKLYLQLSLDGTLANYLRRKYLEVDEEPTE